MTPIELAALLAQPQYPAMTRLESEITRAWLRLFGIAYDRIEFNVRLGEGVELGEGFSEPTRQAALLSTQKRADIIAWLSGRPDVVEVKDRISLGAIGQLLGYQLLWDREHSNETIGQLLVIGRSMMPGISVALRQYEIGWLLFPDVREEADLVIGTTS